MDTMEFEDFFEATVDVLRTTLVKKAKEYAQNTDRLHNFKVAAALQGNNRLQACLGMMAKHAVSVYDLGREYKENPSAKNVAMFDEKLGDLINYSILALAIIKDDYDNK